MGYSCSNSGHGDEEAYVTGDIKGGGPEWEPRPDNSENEQKTNRKSHDMERAPRSSASYTFPAWLMKWYKTFPAWLMKWYNYLFIIKFVQNYMQK